MTEFRLDQVYFIQFSVERINESETTGNRFRNAKGKFSEPTPMEKKCADTIELLVG